MKAVMVMFDTLSRRFLENYGCDWVHTPNFKRLEEHCCRFDHFYGGSMPCMPARRELHTGNYNFMHRGWGPLEPFDFSSIEAMKQAGIYTHLCTDHSHYFEDGGCTYHNRFTTWEAFRGQEGDRWVPQSYGVIPEYRNELSKKGISVKQHYANITRQQMEEEMSSVKTFQAGLEFMEHHANQDNWFLQIESFDPHEPFYVPQKYRDLYELSDAPQLNWPAYGPVDEQVHGKELVEMRREYAALITMCDHYLGKVLDMMDAYDMWKDTMLIVNTDHGFLLGEHGFMGKNFGPMYEEVIHIPFFLYDPKQSMQVSCDALAQTIDIAPTLLDHFGIECPSMDGRSLLTCMRNQENARDVALFGVHGSFTCMCDKDYVYMRANVDKENQPMVECTLMPTQMRGFISREAINQAQFVKGDSYSNGVSYLKIPIKTFYDASMFGDQLFDLKKDPDQKHNLAGEIDIDEFQKVLKDTLVRYHAPEEEFLRLGL